ncbi:hypothetical protein [Bradyrhizobium sp. Y36]|uniref:hypothetical protein n=1 Tax=Bradyrhizobium sp. Y36 TaxID=2035447 RepID=UPI001FE0EAB5|nr:hypothetical protein [Bradyrhizobium sp. Y36]
MRQTVEGAVVEVAAGSEHRFSKPVQDGIITTAGLELEKLTLGTRIGLGPTAVVELTGLRTPCVLIDRFRTGLKRQVVSSAKRALHSDAASWAWCELAVRSRPATVRAPSCPTDVRSGFLRFSHRRAGGTKPLHLRWS